jgi:hypothetical protein
MCGSCTGIQFGDPSAGHFTQSNSSLNQGSSTDAHQWTNGNAAQSRSGSIAEDPKFTGASSSNMKFDGTKSNSGNNPSIGNRGWGS